MNADRYCVMGNPVEHSKSPWIHARFAELTGENVEYTRRLVPLDGFAQAIAAFRAEGGKGCNITVPFKFQAAEVATDETPRAKLAQASNILVLRDDGIHADNTDGAGLVNDLQRNAGVALAGRDILLVGAGGAASGVLGPLIEAAPRSIAVTNRTPEKARSLAARHAALAALHGVELHSPAMDAMDGAYEVVLNATAASMAGAGVPIAASVLKPGALACDLMYGPATDGFMAWARDNGATPRDGLGMLVEQAAEAFLIWRGVRPPSAQVLGELRKFLGLA